MTASKPPAEGTPNVARWTASDATYHPNGGFVAIMDYLDLQRELQAERQRCEAAYTVIGEQKAELIKQGWALTAAESRAASAEDVLRECSKALNSSKVWGGMGYNYSPIHPVNYNKARDAVNDYWNKRQADAASGEAG